MAKAHILMENLGTYDRIYGVYSSGKKRAAALDYLIRSLRADGFTYTTQYSRLHGCVLHKFEKTGLNGVPYAFLFFTQEFDIQ